MRNWANWQFPRQKTRLYTCSFCNSLCLIYNLALDLASKIQTSPLTANTGPAALRTSLQSLNVPDGHDCRIKTESRNPAHSNTAPQTKRKKISFPCCPLFPSPPGAGTATGYITTESSQADELGFFCLIVFPVSIKWQKTTVDLWTWKHMNKNNKKKKPIVGLATLQCLFLHLLLGLYCIYLVYFLFYSTSIMD